MINDRTFYIQEKLLNEVLIKHIEKEKSADKIDIASYNNYVVLQIISDKKIQNGTLNVEIFSVIDKKIIDNFALVKTIAELFDIYNGFNEKWRTKLYITNEKIDGTITFMKYVNKKYLCIGNTYFMNIETLKEVLSIYDNADGLINKLYTQNLIKDNCLVFSAYTGTDYTQYINEITNESIGYNFDAFISNDGKNANNIYLLDYIEHRIKSESKYSIDNLKELAIKMENIGNDIVCIDSLLIIRKEIIFKTALEKYDKYFSDQLTDEIIRMGDMTDINGFYFIKNINGSYFDEVKNKILDSSLDVFTKAVGEIIFRYEFYELIDGLRIKATKF